MDPEDEGEQSNAAKYSKKYNDPVMYGKESVVGRARNAGYESGERNACMTQ